MGIYVNPTSDNFRMSKQSKIYVDKSQLIAETNSVFATEQPFICISRPRRFGKTMAANMLAAYYGRSEDTAPLFEDLNISKESSYGKHLNQYDCIMVNMQNFLSHSGTIAEMIQKLSVDVVHELRKLYPDVDYLNTEHLNQVMASIFQQTKRPFVILIDEWDCIFREYREDAESQKLYLEFLRMWLKNQSYVGLAYMTGILPIKKYGSHSALNMFWEYSMTDPGEYLPYFGFTNGEIEALALKHPVELEEVKSWYNGYFIELGTPIYNPTSVVQSFLRKQMNNYWNQTETYEALKVYIQMNFDGLKDKIIRLLSGERLFINTQTFTNDMTTFNRSDDVLTLLIHLGYLSYSPLDKTITIPNQEVRTEFENAIHVLKWDGVIKAIQNSEALLQSIWRKDEQATSAHLEKVHEQNSSILQYHDENSLSCVVNLGLYGARNYYHVWRELPTGKGFADLVYVPRKNFSQKPALIIELKWDKTAQGAIQQIKDKNYVGALEDYHGNLLLMGINYDKKSKQYECLIEEFQS